VATTLQAKELAAMMQVAARKEDTYRQDRRKREVASVCFC
jgi:hypothetical protein